VTVEPNELCSTIHNRMPLIVPESDVAAGLDPQAAPEAVAPLLKPYSASEMDAYPVSTLVNSPRNESPQCVERVSTVVPGQGSNSRSSNKSALVLNS
jgi:putative SOS response-associated peptidase YedK